MNKVVQPIQTFDDLCKNQIYEVYQRFFTECRKGAFHYKIEN